jgi:hypothetical protein
LHPESHERGSDGSHCKIHDNRAEESEMRASRTSFQSPKLISLNPLKTKIPFESLDADGLMLWQKHKQEVTNYIPVRH